MFIFIEGTQRKRHHCQTLQCSKISKFIESIFLALNGLYFQLFWSLYASILIQRDSNKIFPTKKLNQLKVDGPKISIAQNKVQFIICIFSISDHLVLWFSKSFNNLGRSYDEFIWLYTQYIPSLCNIFVLKLKKMKIFVFHRIIQNIIILVGANLIFLNYVSGTQFHCFRRMQSMNTSFFRGNIYVRGHFSSVQYLNYTQNMSYFPWLTDFYAVQQQEMQNSFIQDPFEVLCNLANIQMVLLMAQENVQFFETFSPIPEAIEQMPLQPIQQPVISQENEREDTKLKRKEPRDLQKQCNSAKKNSESNLVNQFLSFYNSRQKSAKIVLKAIEYLKKDSETSEKILTLFFNVVRMINKSRGRKYVNRTILNNLLSPDTLFDCVPDLAEKMDKVQFVSKEQICQLFRRCLRYFLRTTCVNVILTSKRISIISKDEHFRKRRKIFNSVTQN